MYTDENIERLAHIKRMKPLDFSLEEMRQLVALRDRLAAATGDAEEYHALIEQLRGYATAAAERCQTLRKQLEHAQDFADTLRREVARYGSVSPRDR